MSAALQLQLAARPACRPTHRLAPRCHAQQGGSRCQEEQPSRRSALLLALAAGLAAPRTAAADEPTAAAGAAAVQAEPLTFEFESIPATAVDVDVARWPAWVDRNFSFSYPPGLYEVQVSENRPRATTDNVVENPVKAEVRSEDGRQRIDVVVSQAAAIKRTLFQVTDISQLGDPKAVARLLLPPRSTLLSVSSQTVELASKDTGTVIGVLKRDPVNYYSYEVLLPDRTHVQLTAAAQLGRLYVLGASAPDERWEDCGPALQEAARSFRVRYRL